MKLSFTTAFNQQPNYFLEKIWKGLLQGPANLEESYLYYQGRYLNKFGEFWDGDTYTEFLEPKVHTIRKDKDNKWQAGMEIKMVIHENTPYEFQFVPVLKCQLIQQIQIDYSGFINSDGPAVLIDYEYLDKETLLRLVINDGFANEQDFFNYFSEEFSGKLIHWTGLKYG